MRVLGVSGSPRLGGNTDSLMMAVLKGAESCGAEIERLNVCDLDINPCQHCDFCYRTGDCRTSDDMSRIYDELERADRLVLASPLHFMTVTAQLMAMIDRGQSRWVRKYILKVPPLGDDRVRRALFVSVGGRTAKNLFEPARVTVKAWLVCHDIEYSGEVTFSGIDRAGDIMKHPTAFKQAFHAGQKLVE